LFYKNSLEVIPNPGLTYFSELPVVFYYYEFYNLNKFGGDDKLQVEHIVLNSRDEQKYYKTKLVSRKHESTIDLGAINVKEYPSGAYTLLVTARDSAKKITVYSSKKFYLYNPDIVDTFAIALAEADYLQSEISIMSIDELDEHFNTCDYLSTMDEKNEWKRLETVESKRKFVYDFWKKRDPNTKTTINELKEEYFKRVKYANENFANISQKYGWKTDMGRVYIMYGAPTEVERHPYDVETMPYEIWHYDNIDGGVIFVFADLGNYSDYRLLHSTKRGELSNPNWTNEIKTS
jgi:GWxTD domain-containing protein